MEFDYYHLAEGDEFEEYFKFVRQVAMEDFELCEKAQDNLAKGVYHEGILNPEKENGVSCELSRVLFDFLFRILIFADYQQRVFQMVCEQHRADRKEAINDQTTLEERAAPSMVQMAA